jgi:predicted metalloendopeptidase
MNDHRMKKLDYPLRLALAAACATWGVTRLKAAEAPPRVPRFSIDYMDQSVDPGTDFFHYAAGNWIKANPVPEARARIW